MYLQKINLKNKYALVTGAGKGLGRACALAMAEAGATIIALSRTQSDLDKLERDIKKIKGKIVKIQCDVMNYEDLKNKLEKIKIIDILVNNAGTNIPEPFVNVKQSSMNYLVDLNLKAAFNVAQLVVKKMLKNKKRPGSIINMSSQLGHVGCEGRNVYNMTKFGIEGLTKGMGVELAKNNIRVNTVAPTFVATPMVKNFFKNKKFKKSALDRIPIGKLATESDVATTVCFFSFIGVINDHRNFNTNRWWMDSSVIKKLILFFFIIFNTSANSIEFKGEFFQGHFILGKTKSGAEIIIDKKEINVSEDGYFVFGIDRDRKYDLVITEIFNGQKNKITKKNSKERL